LLLLLLLLLLLNVMLGAGPATSAAPRLCFMWHARANPQVSILKSKAAPVQGCFMSESAAESAKMILCS
jgi:hypothetical protein